MRPLSREARKLPPIWLLGLANAPLGLSGGVCLLTVPQLLAARHVPEPVIAQLTTLALVPTFIVFLIGPILDVRFSRRTYAVGATILSALGTLLVLLQSANLVVLGAGMIAGVTGAAINAIAIGGWFGSLASKEDDATLGAWMVVANAASFGVMAMVAIQLIRAAPLPLAAVLLSAPVLAPLLIYAVTPAPGPDPGLARESFARFFADLAALVRRPLVLQLLLLFAVPAGSFALTNTLGGLGTNDYHASEAFVGIMGGAAASCAGIFGSLIVPPLARRSPARILYLAIGAAGAVFTLSLILLPHTPALFATAMIGENVAQSAALATVNVIALQSLGKDNPFAATQFGLLSCASALPITYMQLLDGHAYGAGGLRLMYLTDAGLGLIACAILAVLLRLWSRGRPVGAEPATA